MNLPAPICLPFCSDCSLQRFEKRESSHKPSAVSELHLSGKRVIVQVSSELAFLSTKVDCHAYACDMKPSGELGLKDFPIPHALTLSRLLLVTSWAFCGALTTISTRVRSPANI
jgi:hypothetical protein